MFIFYNYNYCKCRYARTYIACWMCFICFYDSFYFYFGLLLLLLVNGSYDDNDDCYLLLVLLMLIDLSVRALVLVLLFILRCLLLDMDDNFLSIAFLLSYFIFDAYCFSAYRLRYF